MKITLEMLGAMKKPLGQGPVEVEVEEGTSVKDFMTGTLDYLPGHVERCSYFIDGVKADPETLLTPGCRLRIFMIIGGG